MANFFNNFSKISLLLLYICSMTSSLNIKLFLITNKNNYPKISLKNNSCISHTIYNITKIQKKHQLIYDEPFYDYYLSMFIPNIF